MNYCQRAPYVVSLCILLLGLCVPTIASAQETGQEKELSKPAKEIDLSALGYKGLSPLERFTSKANVTVNFIDDDHVLLTFNPKKLITRLPECPPTHIDRIIHAVVLDIRNGTVTKDADWYVHDERRYLWPLSRGQFLLRRLNSLYRLDADLKETPLLRSTNDLLWTNVSPDGKQIIIETALDEQSEAKQPAQHKPVRPRVKIDFLDAESLSVKNTVLATGVFELEASSSGYADATHNMTGKMWLVRFGPSASERKYLARLKTPCEPNFLFPTNDTLLIGRCTPKGTDYSVSVFTLTGHPLWRQRWSQARHVPTLERSEDGSRIAVSTITGTAGPDSPDSESEDGPGWPDVEQIIRVFETASGNTVLSTKAKSVVLKNQNYSLSPDGSRLAVLDGTALEVYDLAPMPAEERGKYVAMKADAPDLSAPVLQTLREGDGETDLVLGGTETGDDVEPGEADLLSALGKKPVSAERPPAANVTQPSAFPGVSVPAGESKTGGESANPPAATFKASAEEVVVDVVVADSKGHPIKSLPAQDFQIEEDGKNQSVGYFHEFSVAVAATAPASEPVATPKPNVFTNNVLARPDQPVVMIMLDFLNTPFTDQPYAKQQLIRFLKNKPKGTQFALCSLTNRLELIQGFTTDENALLASLNTKKGRIRFSSELEQDTGLPEVIRGEKERAEIDFHVQYAVQRLAQLQLQEQSWLLDRRMALTMDVMAQLARYLSGIPGRKNLVWLSGSLPAGFFGNLSVNSDTPNQSPAMRNYSEQLRSATNLLAQAHVAVYPVDVRGLSADSVLSAASNVDAIGPGAAGSTPQGPPGLTPVSPFAGVNTAMGIQPPNPMQTALDQERAVRSAEQATMDEVATETGGKAFYNSNGIQQAIAEAVEQGSEYYMLSYSPTNRNYDGRFRKIKVSLTRKGYHVAYRHGYYAIDPQAPVKDFTDLSREIGTAAMQRGSPQSHQLLLAARVVPLGKSVKVAAPQAAETSTAGKKKPGPGLVEMQHYSIDYALAGPQMRFIAKGETHQAVLDFMALAFDDNGNVVAKSALQTTSNLNSRTLQDAFVGGLRMHQEVDVPVAATSLRLGVVDELSRRMGTLELPLPLKAPPDEPSLRGRTLPQVEPN